MERIVIVGAGGHAKVIIEILEECGRFEIAGCTSADAGQRELLDIPVLGDDSILPGLREAGVHCAFVALGDNRARWKKAQELAEMGFTLVNAVSPRAIVSRRAILGRGVAVMPGAVINVLTRIEDGAIVNTGATVDHECHLGGFSHVGPGSSLAGCVSVAEGAFLGAGTCVVPGVSIGSWSVIGAGSVVISDIGEFVTAVGAPAAIINSRRSSCR
jgi:UDP-perosamine 4-acetyltransferase